MKSKKSLSLWFYSVCEFQNLLISKTSILIFWETNLQKDFFHLKFGDERDDQNYDEAHVNAVLSFCYEIKKVFESLLLKCW